MNKYENLDQAIVNRIERGGSHPMHCAICLAQAKKVARIGQELFRVIDGRMTALKNSGKIRYNRKLAKWEVLA